MSIFEYFSKFIMVLFKRLRKNTVGKCKNQKKQNDKIYDTPVRNIIYICYFTITITRISLYKTYHCKSY